MLEGLLGGLISPEAKVNSIKETIGDTLESVKAELGCSHSDFIIVIKPTDEENNFKCFILKATPDLVKSVPGAMSREITLKEIVGD